LLRSIRRLAANGMVFVSLVLRKSSGCSEVNMSYLGHWGHSKNGMYYNGIHHDEVLGSGKLGIEREF
jgi:hypothetical protein